jgi:hypothetical protein
MYKSISRRLGDAPMNMIKHIQDISIELFYPFGQFNGSFALNLELTKLSVIIIQHLL